MRKQTMLKFLTIIIIALFCTFFIINLNSFSYDWSGTITSIDGQEGDSELNDKATTIVGAVLGVTRIAAVGIAIIMLIAVAMKYMMSAPGERAEIKKHAVVYIVGAIVLFAASGILSIIQRFASNI